MKISLSYTKLTYSHKAFTALIIRRVRRALREYKLEGDLKVLQEEKNLTSLCVKLLEQAKPHAKITLVKKIGLRVIRPATLEGEVVKALPAIFGQEPFPKTKGLPVTRDVLREEFNVLAKLWKMKPLKPITHPLVEEILKRDKGVWFGLMKSMKHLEKIRKK